MLFFFSLTHVFVLAENIQPVCLPTYGQRLIDGQVGTVTGWGNVGYYGKVSVSLQLSFWQQLPDYQKGLLRMDDHAFAFTCLLSMCAMTPVSTSHTLELFLWMSPDKWTCAFAYLNFFLCVFICLQGLWQMFSKKQTSPSLVMLSVTALITMITKSPPACSVLVMRKEALMPVRWEGESFYRRTVRFLCFYLPSFVVFSLNLNISDFGRCFLSWDQLLLCL